MENKKFKIWKKRNLNFERFWTQICSELSSVAMLTLKTVECYAYANTLSNSCVTFMRVPNTCFFRFEHKNVVDFQLYMREYSSFFSVFRMLRLKNCCCCFDLESGGKFWGWLYAICGAIATLIFFSNATGSFEECKFLAKTTRNVKLKTINFSCFHWNL